MDKPLNAFEIYAKNKAKKTKPLSTIKQALTAKIYDRMVTICKGLEEGKELIEIADFMGISYTAAYATLNTALAKTKLKTRVAIVAKMIRNGDI